MLTLIKNNSWIDSITCIISRDTRAINIIYAEVILIKLKRTFKRYECIHESSFFVTNANDMIRTKKKEFIWIL